MSGGDVGEGDVDLAPSSWSPFLRMSVRSTLLTFLSL